MALLFFPLRRYKSVVEVIVVMGTDCRTYRINTMRREVLHNCQLNYQSLAECYITNNYIFDGCHEIFWETADMLDYRTLSMTE